MPGQVAVPLAPTPIRKGRCHTRDAPVLSRASNEFLVGYAGANEGQIGIRTLGFCPVCLIWHSINPCLERLPAQTRPRPAASRQRSRSFFRAVHRHNVSNELANLAKIGEAVRNVRTGLRGEKRGRTQATRSAP
jgi:hypothetical protein